MTANNEYEPGLLFDKLGKYWAQIADSRSTEEEVEFLREILPKDGVILDLCCGTGRHTSTLFKAGRKVIGVDISANLLQLAKEQQAKERLTVPLVRGEMRHLPFRAEAFTGVVSMFTSMGYLPSKGEDLKCFKEVARVLRHNGEFIIDVANRGRLIRTFRNRDWGEYPSFFIMEKRTLDARELKLHSEWVLIDKSTSKTTTFCHDLRLYTLPSLRNLLEEARLTVLYAYGGYKRQRFDDDSSRLILAAQKT